MGTAYESVIDAFLDRMEKDTEFFLYPDRTLPECLAIAKTRASRYLEEAIVRLAVDGQPAVNFLASENGGFPFELTPIETRLLVSLMVEAYHVRDIEKLATMDVNYTAQELRVFDPSGARTSFKALYALLQEENTHSLRQYRCVNRETGKLNDVGFA